MPRSSRRPQGTPNDLFAATESAAEWYRCEGIFSLHYLKRLLAENSEIPSADHLKTHYDKVRATWFENRAGLQRQNEAYTRQKFLDPTLHDLGWFFLPENALPEGNTRKRPDYCLFADEATEQRVAAESATEIFRASLTAMEAKRFGHSLDQVSTRETPGWFPSQQVQDYLRYATDGTGHRFFRWAILSNGNEWRLYCYDAAPDAYFGFTLVDGDQFCPLEAFRLFVVLLRPAAFERNAEARCWLDALREESLTQQLALEAKLRKRIFDVLEDLAQGFFNNPANGLKESDLRAIYEASLIFLYRLLFILYAESRGLLPVRYGPGANARYRNEFSLARLVDRLRDSNSYPDDAFDGLYQELLKLFHLVNGTRRDQNERLNVTRYNGRLFSPQEYPNLENCWVGEKTLANVLRQLMFAQPKSSRAGQQLFSTEDTIDYSSLEVRQLGDIYEGLLGGRLQESAAGRLTLVNERGENQRHGIFYTPDWVVVFLVRETLQPLLDEIDARPEVQTARNAKSLEKQQDNSFALAVLRLNVVDPAMGSGHFLVRATEFLAEAIFHHPTTRRMTEQIVATGTSRRSREQILADGRHPVSPGLSQEQAELAYWRRRVVEACIYGVDTNPLAVELTKLSLWLTCIAIDEPLNFLDHHLRTGNALLGAQPEELHRLPAISEAEAREGFFNIGDQLTQTLATVIEESVHIEEEASTEMDVVKNKERRWRQVRAKLQPFLEVGDIWTAALDDLAINHLGYRALAKVTINHPDTMREERASVGELREELADALESKKKSLQPFHWRLEFPDVFYQTNGVPRPEAERGFDAVLGNPPYVSTHTSSEQAWRKALEKRVGYLEDTYVHFTDQGLCLLRPGGLIGFIVSDTFFTLESKKRMREWLERNRLLCLGQCYPFEATVDAAIFVARKEPIADEESLVFIQARHRTQASRPEKVLPNMQLVRELSFPDAADALGVRHLEYGCLRLHRAPIRIFRNALNQTFFEPSPPVLELYRRFNEPLKRLVDEWWERIETSAKFAENAQAIREYQRSLNPGDVTLVGLIAEGGQGMRTANNGRFVGYLEGTPQAREIETKRQTWTREWLSNPRVKRTFLRLLTENGGDPAHPEANVATWEACVEPLKSQFDARRELELGRTDLYRVVPRALLAGPDDFSFAFQRRKAELMSHWQSERQLDGFWEEGRLLAGSQQTTGSLRNAASISDADFCRLCQEIVSWWGIENERRKSQRPRGRGIPREALALRSSECYADPADAARIAIIYNGLSGHGQWVPFRKGDPEGNRWADNEPLFINWSESNVDWFFDNSGRPESGMPVMRNAHLYFTEGVTWTAVANHVAMKARYQDACVFDADSMRLTPRPEILDPMVFLALLNSDVVSFMKMKFIKHTQKWEIGDLRLLAVVMPTREQAGQLAKLAQCAITAKRLTFGDNTPPNELVAFTRELSQQLRAEAPVYLKPDAQLFLLETAADCLKIIELAVNWEAEKLYGVEGLGPFDEF